MGMITIGTNDAEMGTTANFPNQGCLTSRYHTLPPRNSKRYARNETSSSSPRSPLHLTLVQVLLVATVSELGMLSDSRSIKVKDEGDTTARQCKESQKGRSPLVTKTSIHLRCEEHCGGAPEGTQTRLGGESTGSLMLVRVDEIIVCGIVEEDEAEADWETSDGRTDPVELWVGRPCEYEEADRDEPARDHHWDETGFCWWCSVVFLAETEVVLVDHGSAGSRTENAQGDWDEHQAGDGCRVSLSLLIDDGIGNEEHVEQAVQYTHVDGDE